MHYDGNTSAKFGYARAPTFLALSGADHVCCRTLATLRPSVPAARICRYCLVPAALIFPLAGIIVINPPSD
jgi:hypothetical protein